MSKRFFEKSDYIEELSDSDVQHFLRKEKVVGKVEQGRVKDFYNKLSRISAGEEEKFTDAVDYSYFNCKTQEDMDKVDRFKSMETDFLNKVDGRILNESRMLKAATYLATEFEKMLAGEQCDSDENLNKNLRRLLEYHEEQPEGKNATFGEVMQMDLTFLNYLALLSNKKAFQKRDGKYVRSPDGRITRLAPMETFDELSHMDLFQSVLPNFNRKLAQKDVYVRAKYDKIDRAQNLILLIDDSGSMNAKSKRAMLKAALTLKLQNVSENTNIYIGTFETELFGFLKVDKETTFERLRSIIFLNKGNTDVNGCIMETIKQIKERRLMDRNGGFHTLSEDSFEVMVVNDGQDHVDETYHPVIKTHALCLVQSNPQLKNVCHRSGGTYFHIHGSEED